MSRFQSAADLDAESQDVFGGKNPDTTDEVLESAVPVVRHDKERMAALRFTDLQHRGDVGVARQSPHRALFTRKTRSVFVELGGENLDRDNPIQFGLRASKNDAESSYADLFSPVETGRTQVGGNGASNVTRHASRVTEHQ